MNVTIISKNYPYASVTEESCSLIDFLRVYREHAEELPKFRFLSHYKLEEEQKADLFVVCLYDGMTGPELMRIAKLLTGEVLLFQPTMKFQPTDKSLEAAVKVLKKRHTVNLLANNDRTWEPDIYTDCVDPKYFPQHLSSDDARDVAVLDLLEDTQMIFTEVSMREVIPFLNAQRSRKFEGLPPMTVLSNLGMSSLKASPISLHQNGLDVAGICWETDRPEFYMREGRNFYYPAIKSKAFGRWAYIAERNRMKVISDVMHGYQSFKGSSLEEAIQHV
jgi:hypothetical protein